MSEKYIFLAVENDFVNIPVNDENHLKNLLNYYYHIGKSKRHENDQTKYNWVYMPGVSEYDIYYFNDRNKREKTASVHEKIVKEKLGDDKISEHLFMLNLIHYDEKGNQVDHEFSPKEVASIVGGFLDDSNVDLISMVCHVDQGASHLHILYFLNHNENSDDTFNGSEEMRSKRNQRTGEYEKSGHNSQPCDHEWVPVFHEEMGHYQKIVVQGGYYKRVSDGDAYVCSCGARLNSFDEWMAHFASNGCNGYYLENNWKETWVAPIYDERYVVDCPAYTSYRCAKCGAEK